MSETPIAENPFAAVTWPESYLGTAPDAVSCAGKADSSVDSPSGGIGTATPAENAVYGVMRSRIAPNGQFIPFGMEWSEQEQRVVPMQLVREEPVCGSNLDTAMRVCGQADESAPATGTEALVCRDIAKRQRKGIAKYRNTVANNPLTFAKWLQHFYEELLDASVYAKRILTKMNHEPENQTDSDRNADGVQPASDPVVHRHRKPGAGRKAKPCPGCGAVKSIGSTVKNGIPTRRCKACKFIVRQYHHLANGKTAAEMA